MEWVTQTKNDSFFPTNLRWERTPPFSQSVPQSISPSSSTTTSIETPSSDSAEGEIASNAAEMMTIGFEFNLNPFDWVRVTDQEAIGVPVQPENAEVLRLRAAWSASIPELDPTKFRLLSQSVSRLRTTLSVKRPITIQLTLPLHPVSSPTSSSTTIA